MENNQKKRGRDQFKIDLNFLYLIYQNSTLEEQESLKEEIQSLITRCEEKNINKE